MFICGTEFLQRRDSGAIMNLIRYLNKKIYIQLLNFYTDLIKGENGVYLAYVEKREKPDMEKFEAEKEELMAEAQTTAENEHLNEWYKELKENAEIEDNRKDFFSL